MKKILYVCDRCGKEHADSDCLFGMEISESKPSQRDYTQPFKADVELCEACSRVMIRVWEQGMKIEKENNG